MVHPGPAPFGYNVSAATTLPLLGFWNAVIYTTISWTAVKRLFAGGLGGTSICRCRAAICRKLRGETVLPTVEDREDYPPRAIRMNLAERLTAMTDNSNRGWGCMAN